MSVPPECLDDDPPEGCYEPAPEFCDVDSRAAPYCSGPSDQGSDLLDEVAGEPTTESTPSPEPPPVEPLPAAGGSLEGIALLAAMLLAMGAELIRRSTAG